MPVPLEDQRILLNTLGGGCLTGSESLVRTVTPSLTGLCAGLKGSSGESGPWPCASKSRSVATSTRT